MSVKYQLKNGMDVILVENHKSPVVSVQMWIKTGSADEPKHLAGVSHFIEHLVFKGTEKFGVGEIASCVEGSGGELNAYTSFDQTVFHVTISKEFQSTGLEVISQMMGFPSFDKKEINNEREVVIEEIKRGQDSLGNQASQLLFSTLFKNHPYGSPVIGFEEIIRNLSREEIVQYFEERYVPENMFLLVTGDFDRQEMKQLIRSKFECFKKKKLKKSLKTRAPKYTSPQIRVKESSFEDSIAYLSWPAPAVNHEDIPALDVLSMILGQGESSRLVRAMTIDERLLQGVGASAYTPRRAGLFAISLVLHLDQLERALQVCGEKILEIIKTPPSQDELKRAIVNMEVGELFSLETVDGIARKTGELEFLLGDYKYFKKYIKQVRSLTSDRISEVARKYLKPQFFHGIMLSSEKPQKAEKTLKSWQKKYSEEFKKIKKPQEKQNKKLRLKKNDFDLNKVSKKRGHIKVSRYKQGHKGVFFQSNETPIVSIKAAFLGGSRDEPEGKEGLSEVFSRLLGGGTELRNENEIYKDIENLGAHLSSFSGRNTTGLSLNVVNRFEKEGTEVFSEILSIPVFDEKILLREKEALVEQIKSSNDNSGQRAIRQFHEGLFETHPYAKDPQGSIESVMSIHKKDIEDFWSKIAQRKNFTFSLAGPYNKDFSLKALNKVSKSLGGGKKIQKKYLFTGPKENKMIYSQADKEQSHIVIGYKGLNFKSKRVYDLQVIQAVLAGQGGRLFLELRDKESLAYTVTPMHMEGIDGGYFGAYIGCSPEKAKKAVKMLRIEFRKLMEEQISEEELNRAKRYLIGRHGISLQRMSSVCGSMLFNEIYDLPAREVFDYSMKVSEVSSKSIHKLCQKIFDQPEILSLVGPREI